MGNQASKIDEHLPVGGGTLVVSSSKDEFIPWYCMLRGAAPWCWYIKTYMTGGFCSAKCWWIFQHHEQMGMVFDSRTCVAGPILIMAVADRPIAALLHSFGWNQGLSFHVGEHPKWKKLFIWLFGCSRNGFPWFLTHRHLWGNSPKVSSNFSFSSGDLLRLSRFFKLDPHCS